MRVPMLNPDQVQSGQVNSYSKLADKGLAGKLCLRNRKSVYNQSLVAFMLDRTGEAASARWIRGMVANLAQPVFSSDTPMIRAVAQGQCGVALANTYYLGRLQAGDKGAADKALSKGVEVAARSRSCQRHRRRCHRHQQTACGGQQRNSWPRTKRRAATPRQP